MVWGFRCPFSGWWTLWRRWSLIRCLRPRTQTWMVWCQGRKFAVSFYRVDSPTQHWPTSGEVSQLCENHIASIKPDLRLKDVSFSSIHIGILFISLKVVWDTLQLYNVERILKSNYNYGFNIFKIYDICPQILL